MYTHTVKAGNSMHHIVTQKNAKVSSKETMFLPFRNNLQFMISQVSNQHLAGFHLISKFIIITIYYYCYLLL